MKTRLLCKKLDPNAKLPTYAHDGDAGLDLIANEDICIPRDGKWYTVSTGISVAIANGYYGKLASRSGLARRDNVECFHGTLDSTYRGEVLVLMRAIDYEGEGDNIYAPDMSHHVNKGDKIAQLIILPYEQVDVVECESLPETSRGENGFGSTDKKVSG